MRIMGGGKIKRISRWTSKVWREARKTGGYLERLMAEAVLLDTTQSR